MIAIVLILRLKILKELAPTINNDSEFYEQ